MTSELNCFGVIIILPECSFRAELPRENISEILKDIDEQLTSQGIPEEKNIRNEVVITNCRILSTMIANNNENDHSVSDIAFGFVYVLGNVLGIEQLSDIRGMVGSYLQNKLKMNPCLTDIDFQQESFLFSRKIEDHDKNPDEEWDSEISPTFH